MAITIRNNIIVSLVWEGNLKDVTVDFEKGIRFLRSRMEKNDMSIIDSDKVDGMGKRNNELILLITDHLEWENEYEHLLILQNKINSYLGFIETKQYKETYPNTDFDNYVIEIHFLNDISKNCLKLLDVIANQVEEFNIKIRINSKNNS